LAYRHAILALLVTLPILLYIPFLAEPFERDEGVWAVVARTILDGGLPYRDVFDHKPPLAYAPYVVSAILFGDTVAGPRILAALYLSATTAVVFAIGRLLFLSDGKALVAAGLFATMTGMVSLQANANTEVFMVLPMAGALVALLAAHKSERASLYFLAGVLGGAAILTKHVAAPPLVLALALSLPTSRPPTVHLRRVALALAGLAFVGVLVLAPFAALGAIDDLVYANLTYNRLFAAELDLRERLDNASNGVRFFAVAAGPFVLLALIGFFVAARKRSIEARLVCAWAFGCAIGVAMSGRFWPHYFVQLWPAMALLGAVALTEAPVVLKSRAARLAVAAPTSLVILASLLTHVTIYAEPTVEARHARKFPAPQAEVQIRSSALGAYLRSQTSPNQTIFNWGRETQVYFYADRRAPTKYVYDRPFWLDAKTFEAALRDLEAAPPSFIFDTAAATRGHPPEFSAFLRRHYTYVGRVEFADVYRLRGSRNERDARPPGTGAGVSTSGEPPTQDIAGHGCVGGCYGRGISWIGMRTSSPS
jgi:hypothetical protein